MDLDAEVDAVTRALTARHPVFATETVARLVRRMFARYEGARVTAFLPVLVQREVGARLRAIDDDFAPCDNSTAAALVLVASAPRRD